MKTPTTVAMMIHQVSEIRAGSATSGYSAPASAPAFASMPASSERYEAANSRRPRPRGRCVMASRSMPSVGERLQAAARTAAHARRGSAGRLAVVAVGGEGLGRQGVHRVRARSAPRRSTRREARDPWCWSRPRAAAAPVRPSRREPPSAAGAAICLKRRYAVAGVGDGDGAAQLPRSGARVPARSSSGSTLPSTRLTKKLATSRRRAVDRLALRRPRLEPGHEGVDHLACSAPPRRAA